MLSKNVLEKHPFWHGEEGIIWVKFVRFIMAIASNNHYMSRLNFSSLKKVGVITKFSNSMFLKLKKKIKNNNFDDI